MLIAGHCNGPKLLLRNGLEDVRAKFANGRGSDGTCRPTHDDTRVTKIVRPLSGARSLFSADRPLHSTGGLAFGAAFSIAVATSP